MLIEYIQAAMRNAKYAILQDGEGYYGRIPAIKGVWANAETLEECRDELQQVLEEWIVLGLRLGKSIPAIDGIELKVAEEMA